MILLTELKSLPNSKSLLFNFVISTRPCDISLCKEILKLRETVKHSDT